jgi:AAA ATPase domain/PDZ domain
MLDLRVFVSSPHDVGNERAVCGTVVARLQLEFRGVVRLQPIFWENELLQPDKSFQPQLPRASQADACVFILWSWFGTPLSPEIARRPDGTTYLSGTEFEFEDAMASRRAHGTPDMFVYRKIADVPISVRSREVELMQRSQRDALNGFLDKWFGGEGGPFKAAFYEFEHPARFEELLETHLRRWVIEELERAGVAAAAARREAQWKGSPFRGLKPFDIDDALIFCGRTQAVTDLLDLLRRRAAAGRPFALVMGRSGAGKSSLVRAGLLPMLTQPSVIHGAIAWRRGVFRPSDVAGRPVAALAAAIVSESALPEIAAGATDAGALAKLLGENPAAVAPLIRLALARVGETARAALPPGSEGDARLVLVIDQFEEIFTQEGVQSTDRAAFVAALQALAGSGQVWIVATIRADFYPRCQDLPSAFLELCPRDAVFELMPPTPEEISQMIRRPARLAGLDFEKRVDHDEGLDDVLRDAAIANPGSLPLLQFALDELYSRAGAGRILRFKDYEQMGRVEGALQERAETELKALAEDAQAALPLVLSHLVQLDLKTGAVAQRRLSYARVAADPDCRALIDWFVDKRLFESDRGSDGEAVIGVAHEALLRGWKRARDWIERNQAFLRLRARIGAAELLWREEGRPDRLLLPEGQALGDAAALKAERGAELGAAELAYIDQSLALARRARSWRRARALAAGIAALALGAAGAWYAWAYVMPVSAYYEDYEMRWGFPEGRGVVSADTASHRSVTYKLTRRGALGRVIKVESLNGSTKCAQTNEGDTPFGESADEYDYLPRVQCSVEFEESSGRIARQTARDRAGREIYSLYYTDWSPKQARAQYWVDKEMRPEISGAVVIRYEYVEGGQNAGLVAHKWFTDATDDPKPNKDGIFGFRHAFDERGHTTEVARLDKDGKHIDLNKKASLWRNSFDSKSGRLIELRYFNSSDAKMVDAGGHWRIEYFYDPFGNETSEIYYDLNDRPLGQKPEESSSASAGAKSTKPGEASAVGDKKSGALPVAKWAASYDEHGNQVEIRRFDWRGQPVRKEAAIERIDYDGDGRRIGHRYFDDNDRPTPDSDGDIAYAIEYGTDGNRMAIHYLDGDLRPAVPPKRGCATVRYRYDENGDETDESYFDTTDAPAPNIDGVARIHYHYARGLEDEAIWYKEHDERVTNSNRYSRRHTDYDSYGRVSEYHYYDANDAPMQPPQSAATIRILYDQNGNRISRVNLDQNGNPVDLEGWAEWIDEFDRENRHVRTLYFDAEGRPALGPEKYASVVRRYDRDGNQIRTEYLGPDLKRVVGPEGYALGTWQYKEGRLDQRWLYAADGSSVRTKFDQQGHEIEKEYLDAEDKLRIDAAIGCARVAKVYNAEGFLLEASYFDADDRLCVAKDLHYAHEIWIQKDPRTWQAKFQDASGAPTTNGSGAIEFTWTQSDDPARGEGRQTMPDGRSVVVVPSGELVAEYRYYDAAGNPTEDNDFHALRVTFSYDNDKKLMERVRYRADGVVEHERFSTGELVEIDYTDGDGNPTDKNELHVFRTLIERAGDGKETGRTNYRSGDLVDRWTFRSDDDAEVVWSDSSGKVVDGPLGYAHCHMTKQTECVDSEGRILVQVVAVEGVMPDSPAEHAELHSGDLLISYEGKPVTEMNAFIDQVTQPGPSARILVVAREGQRLAISVPPGRLGIQIHERYVLPTNLGSP